MVHIFCLNERCRRVIHLGSYAHWNFKGKVKCLKCGEEMEVEIKNGKQVSATESPPYSPTLCLGQSKTPIK